MSDKLKADLTKLKVEVRWHEDMWGVIKNATMTTIGKDKGKYPDSEWKRKMLMGEHSPIRIGHFVIKIYNCPQFVHGHLVRHPMGVTPFISTLRSDRNNYNDVPNRYTLQDGEYSLSFQAIINISRKRLCNCASVETRYVWKKVLEAIKEFEPELYDVCVPQCVRNAHCYEVFPCGYSTTKSFEKALQEYRKGVNE